MNTLESVLGFSERAELEKKLTDWGLSPGAISILVEEPEIVAQLEIARSLPPFDADYYPTLIEERFDDVGFRRWESGELIFALQVDNYKAPFVEYRFDGQTALFHVNGEIIINRLENMANRAATLGLLLTGEVSEKTEPSPIS